MTVVDIETDLDNQVTALVVEEDTDPKVMKALAALTGQEVARRVVETEEIKGYTPGGPIEVLRTAWLHTEDLRVKPEFDPSRMYAAWDALHRNPAPFDCDICDESGETHFEDDEPWDDLDREDPDWDSLRRIQAAINDTYNRPNGR